MCNNGELNGLSETIENRKTLKVITEWEAA